MGFKQREWRFTDRTWVVNGRVHAICSAADRLIVYIQKPEHFVRCKDCHIYSTYEAFTCDQSMIQLGTGIDRFVECGVDNCPYCEGKKVMFGHPWSGKESFPRRKHGWTGWRLPPSDSGVL